MIELESNSLLKSHFNLRNGTHCASCKGIYELTVAVLSGWEMVATIERPEALIRAGVRHLGRIRQAHLDLLFQGTILTVTGIAMNPIPTGS